MIDEIFHYKVKANSFPAKCRVRIKSNTVIATELPDNEGMSITNAAEEVAMQVCQFYEIPIAQLVWIEHYPQRADIDETFDAVDFEIVHNYFSNPSWKPTSRTLAEELIGCSLYKIDD